MEVSPRLKNLLQEYYPQALPMLGPQNWDPINLTFLRKWPSYSQLMKAKEETLEKFYYASSEASDALSLDSLLEELGRCECETTSNSYPY